MFDKQAKHTRRVILLGTSHRKWHFNGLWGRLSENKFLVYKKFDVPY
jgi:hypothetical protein